MYVCMLVNLGDEVLYGQLHLISPETSQNAQSFQRRHVAEGKRKLSSVRITTFIHTHILIKL